MSRIPIRHRRSISVPIAVPIQNSQQPPRGRNSPFSGESFHFGDMRRYSEAGKFLRRRKLGIAPVPGYQSRTRGFFIGEPSS